MHDNDKIRAYLKKHPDAVAGEIAAALGCTPQRAGRVRTKMIEEGELAVDAEVIDSTAMVPAAPPSTRASQRARIAELEEENVGYQQRVIELLEHVAELSQENLRLSRLARQEG